MSVKLMAAVWERGPQDQRDLLMLLAIADHANDDGVCWPSVQLLANKSRCSRSTAYRTMKRLYEAGFLSGVPVYRETTTLTVLLPDSPPVSAPENRAAVSRCETVESHGVRQLQSQGLTDRTIIEPSGNHHSRRRVAKAPADPRVTTLLKAFTVAHQQALQQPYLVRGGRDGSHLKDALRHYDEATILKALPLYLAEPSKIAINVPNFVAKIASLIGTKPTVVPPGPPKFQGHGYVMPTAEQTRARWAAIERGE